MNWELPDSYAFANWSGDVSLMYHCIMIQSSEMNQSKVVSSHRILYCLSNQSLIYICCGSVEASDRLEWRIEGDVCIVLFGSSNKNI